MKLFMLKFADGETVFVKAKKKESVKPIFAKTIWGDCEDDLETATVEEATMQVIIDNSPKGRTFVLMVDA